MELEQLEFQEAKHAWKQEYSNSYYSANREIWIKQSHWTAYYLDWLHLQFGSKCDWCERTNQEIKLEVDHIIGKIRFLSNDKTIHINSSSISQLLRDFDNGEPLRLLCIQCHEVRHGL